ncbi:MAG: hypothetical protein JWR16_709 [Nevskia sp.]|nr:hypothetical protein [Nevskia sp.]
MKAMHSFREHVNQHWKAPVISGAGLGCLALLETHSGMQRAGLERFSAKIFETVVSQTDIGVVLMLCVGCIGLSGFTSNSWIRKKAAFANEHFQKMIARIVLFCTGLAGIALLSAVIGFDRSGLSLLAILPIFFGMLLAMAGFMDWAYRAPPSGERTAHSAALIAAAFYLGSTALLQGTLG